MYQMQPANEVAGWAALVEEDSNDKDLYTVEQMQVPELVGL
jgi:hypothetical protein